MSKANDNQSPVATMIGRGHLTLMTPAMRKKVDTIMDNMVLLCSRQINRLAPEIQAMDKRPKETWTPEKPDVYFRYVNQAMLEEFIRRLEELV